MLLGEKLKQARLAAGMSQRELCGEQITRNMLSRIENAAAMPSMDTLRYLAARLGKPVSFFLEEEAQVSPNLARMRTAREALDAQDFSRALAALDDYREGDLLLDREAALVRVLALLGSAKAAATEGRTLYAVELCDRASAIDCPYCADALNRERAILLGSFTKSNVSALCAQLPPLDAELMLRARSALEAQELSRAAALLDACEQRTDAWEFLRGQVYLAGKDYEAACACFLKAQAAYPEDTAPCLEVCYREMGDYRSAYFYACMQRK